MGNITRFATALLLAASLAACSLSTTATPEITAYPMPSVSAPVTCVGISDDYCGRSLDLVLGSYASDVASADAIVIGDRCQPETVCHGGPPVDVLALIGSPSSGHAITLRLYGNDGPERVEVFTGEIPSHLSQVMP